MENNYQTQQRMILDALLMGKVLTVSDGLKIAKTHDLRKHVSDLKKKGHSITGTWVTLPNKKRIKQYFINKKPRG